MRVRFQADADLNQILLKATLRREPSIDFQTAFSAGLAALGDTQVLAIAAREGRILVTHDRKTMPRHSAEFIATEASAGVIVVSRTLAVNAVVDDLILIGAQANRTNGQTEYSHFPYESSLKDRAASRVD